MQGLAESLEAMHHSASISRAWEEWSTPEILPNPPEDSPFRTLTEAESKELLTQHGFAVPKSRLVEEKKVSAAAEAIGFPVVVKVVATDMLHKTECGGVALNLKNVLEVVEAVAGMSELSKTFLVEEMITDGVAELLLGVSVDPQFGPTITLGAGGILTELLLDSVSLLLPISEKQVRQAIRKLRVNTLLQGLRGRPEGDKEALIQAVFSLADFIKHHAGRLSGSEINPLIVRPSGKGVIVVDALIQIKET